MRDIDELTYNAIINYICDFESKDNDNIVDKNIIINRFGRDPFNYIIQYSVKYQSKLTYYINKWETKKIKIDIDGVDFMSYLRDAKINEVLGSPSLPVGFSPESFR
jgi:hypothetical protein